MARQNRIPDFRKMYPEASEEVIALLKISERKMQYQEYDLKATQPLENDCGVENMLLAGREDSYERLVEQGKQFISAEEDLEERIIRQDELRRLHEAIKNLPREDLRLVIDLFVREKTERDLAVEYGIYHNAIHKQKRKILKKLKRILEDL